MIRSFLAVLFFLAFIYPLNAGSIVHDNNRICGTSSFQIESLQLQNFRKISAVSKNYQIGESKSFYTYNFETEKYETITATLQTSDPAINIWVEDDEWNTNVKSFDVAEILNALNNNTPGSSIAPDQGIVQIAQTVYGTAPDVDNNNKIDFLITDIKDGWGQDQSGFIAGYFSPSDQFANGPGNSHSNEMDMLYIDSHPGITQHRDDDFGQVLSTVAHEFQHLIQFGNDQEEKLFVNEGLSELSSFLCGYGLRNPSEYLRHTDISLVDFKNDIDVAIRHYSKVALWTYYLYENYGTELISAISKNSYEGKTGINAALLSSQINLDFNDLFSEFVREILENDQGLQLPGKFSENLLNGFAPVPLTNIDTYPEAGGFDLLPYSFHTIRFTNGDSLRAEFDHNSFIQILSVKTGPDSISGTDEINFTDYANFEFGQKWLLEDLAIMNLAEYNNPFSFSAEASERNYIISSKYSSNAPDFSIRMEGDIPAIQFSAPYDSTLLKGFTFFNSQSEGPVNIKVYENMPANREGNIIAQKLFANLLSGGKVYIDLEEFEISGNSGQNFYIGIEYLGSGAIGYNKSPANLGVAYLNFTLLNNYQVSNESLTGFWNSEVSYAVPLWRKPVVIPVKDFELLTSNVVLGPNPQNPSVKIEYKLFKPGNVRIDIVNILGQTITTIFEGYEEVAIPKFWNGQNSHGSMVASGMYFLRLQKDNKADVVKIMLIR